MAGHFGSNSKPYRKEMWPSIAEVYQMKPKNCPRCKSAGHNVYSELIDEYFDGRDVNFRCIHCAHTIVPKLTPTMVIISEREQPQQGRKKT
jgi:hypothetical protein